MSLRPIVHRDGTVTYWSVHAQAWRRRVRYISADDAAALPTADRARVLRACYPTARSRRADDETAHYRAY